MGVLNFKCNEEATARSGEEEETHNFGMRNGGFVFVLFKYFQVMSRHDSE